MHRVGYRAVKILVCVKKNLKYLITFVQLKLKPLKNECRNMCHTLIFVLNIKIFFPFLILLIGIFFNPPQHPNYKIFQAIFFNELVLKNWAMNMHFNPIPILYGLYLGGGAWAASQSIHRFRPTSLYRVKQANNIP